MPLAHGGLSETCVSPGTFLPRPRGDLVVLPCSLGAAKEDRRKTFSSGERRSWEGEVTGDSPVIPSQQVAGGRRSEMNVIGVRP